MKYRIISVEHRSKYDKEFIGKRLIKSDKPYYIVQYKKDPSFFGLIKHNWKDVYYNAEEIAKKFRGTEIALEPQGVLYEEKDCLVPNIDYAKQLLQLTKNCFTDPDTESSIKVIYEEEDTVCKPMDLTKEYTDLIEK